MITNPVCVISSASLICRLRTWASRSGVGILVTMVIEAAARAADAEVRAADAVMALYGRRL
jgi:hypothetical protein